MEIRIARDDWTVYLKDYFNDITQFDKYLESLEQELMEKGYIDKITNELVFNEKLTIHCFLSNYITLFSYKFLLLITEQLRGI